jgi:predicted GIY-YIG superfamily endonuclease
MTHYIYGLFDPRSEAAEIRYIGMTTNLQRRQSAHKWGRGYHGAAYREWILSLHEAGTFPAVTVLEECDEKTWRQAERRWIAEYRQRGDLLNVLDGGEAPPVFTEETRRRMAQALMGREVTWQTRGRISDALQGHQVAQEARDKLREAQAKQFENPEARERHRDGLRQWYRSLSDDKKKNVLSGLEIGRRPEHQRSRINNRWSRLSKEERAAYGKEHWKDYSPEAQAKFRAARWADGEAKEKQAGAMSRWWRGLSPEARADIVRRRVESRRAKRLVA